MVGLDVEVWLGIDLKIWIGLDVEVWLRIDLKIWIGLDVEVWLGMYLKIFSLGTDQVLDQSSEFHKNLLIYKL